MQPYTVYLNILFASHQKKKKKKKKKNRNSISIINWLIWLWTWNFYNISIYLIRLILINSLFLFYWIYFFPNKKLFEYIASLLPEYQGLYFLYWVDFSPVSSCFVKSMNHKKKNINFSLWIVEIMTFSFCL